MTLDKLKRRIRYCGNSKERGVREILAITLGPVERVSLDGQIVEAVRLGYIGIRGLTVYLTSDDYRWIMEYDKEA